MSCHFLPKYLIPFRDGLGLKCFSGTTPESLWFPRSGFRMVLPEGALSQMLLPRQFFKWTLGLLFPQLCPTWHRHDAFNLMVSSSSPLWHVQECLSEGRLARQPGQQVHVLDSPWAHPARSAFSDARLIRFPLYNPCFSSCCPSQSLLPSWPFHWTMGALRKELWAQSLLDSLWAWVGKRHKSLP